MTRDLDVVLTLAAFAITALWLCLHDPQRRDLRDLNRHQRARRRSTR